MTGAEWLSGDDPAVMLEFIRGKASIRRLRLFAVACCRRVASSVYYAGYLEAVEVAEQHADGLRDDAALEAAHNAEQELVALNTPLPMWDGTGAMEFADWVGANASAMTCTPAMTTAVAAQAAKWAPDLGSRVESADEARATQGHLLRDIFGNPLRPITLDLNWRTSTVVALAQGIYQERDFSAMPILADALQDAGCENADILDHCRGPGPHVRGCWVVDLVLGKE